MAILPTDRQFDAVVSSRAIHHVVDDRKQALYVEIFQLLKPGGCFANHDLVRKPDDPIRDSHDPFGTVEDQVVWLKNIGLLMWNAFGRRRAVPCLEDISQVLRNGRICFREMI